MMLSMFDTVGAAYMEQKNTITFFTPSQVELLRITQDGFYVRGVKVPQDDKEAEAVYKTFHQWLTWATLNREF